MAERGEERPEFGDQRLRSGSPPSWRRSAGTSRRAATSCPVRRFLTGDGKAASAQRQRVRDGPGGLELARTEPRLARCPRRL